MLTIKRPLVFFDLETTGTDTQKDRIIQIGAVIFLPGTKKNTLLPGTPVEYLVNPTVPVPAEASDVHGFYDYDLADKPTFADLIQPLRDIFENSDWVGFNIVRFDAPLLLKEFSRCGVKFMPPAIIDVMRIHKVKNSSKLEALLKAYCGKQIENAHDALVDITATADILWEMIGRYKLPRTVDELAALSKYEGQLDLENKLKLKDGRLFLNFGKHKGEDLATVPKDYLRWAYKEDIFGVDAINYMEKYFRAMTRGATRKKTKKKGKVIYAW